MNKEDYGKYYIQGSDHYLIPKDVFNELFDEMVNWKEETKELNQKYLNAVADYETTMFEKEQLNSLVNSCQEEIRQLKKQLEPDYYVNHILQVLVLRLYLQVVSLIVLFLLDNYLLNYLIALFQTQFFQ